MSNYGSFAELVGTVGSLMAAVGAIILSFKGRARWEPSEEDIPKGPQKIAGLAAATIVAILWAMAEPEQKEMLARLAAILAFASVFFLLLYGFLAGLFTYEKIIVVDGELRATKTIKIIGGCRLTTKAKRTVAKGEITVQDYFEGVAYDPDKVWTRGSRALTKQLFVAAYIGLIACGATALSSASLLVGLEDGNGDSVRITPTSSGRASASFK